ncbi:hypothetical protein K3495_g11000 [Podosphaera aphanis]|nr:hypothetical protein K3495_g11000 [Podosphaera aphanis]
METRTKWRYQIVAANQKTTVTDNGTAAIASIDGLKLSLGVQMAEIKSVGYYLNKVRDNLVMSGAKTSSSTMKEVEKALVDLNMHVKGLEKLLKATPMEERMLALEKVVRKSLVEGSTHKATPAKAHDLTGRKTYASILVPPVTKAAVRIRVEGSDKMQPSELLNKAKQHITGAYAVRKLRSCDTEVFVQSVSQRDAALRMPQPKEFQVLNQDFPVEILGVSLETRIEKGKDANNGNVINKIIEETKVRIPGIKIGRLRWLHDGKELQWAKKNRHTKGSVILSLPTEALQHEVVRNGIVLNSMLHTAQL